jgi:hypothetical protein
MYKVVHLQSNEEYSDPSFLFYLMPFNIIFFIILHLIKKLFKYVIIKFFNKMHGKTQIKK